MMPVAADVTIFQHPVPRPAWLALHTEEIIEPALPIIDPHHHLWARDGQDYFLDELLADLGSGHNIVATVFLQCSWAYRKDGAEALRPVGETEYVAGVADAAALRGCTTKVCAGIVGHADMNLGEAVDAVLEAHIAAAGGRFRGIRHLTAREETFWASIAPPPPARMMGTDRFRAGIGRLERFGLSFDAWLYHTQISELTALARAFPGTAMVLNHFGGVMGIGRYEGRRDAVFADWHAAIRELASCANVSIKLGGFGMMLPGFGFNGLPRPPSSETLAAAWRPYFEACIEAFGPDRCMFESNFPVDKAMFSYAVAWNAFKRLAAGASAGEKAALFHDTAARVYRLEA